MVKLEKYYQDQRPFNSNFRIFSLGESNTSVFHSGLEIVSSVLMKDLVQLTTLDQEKEEFNTD